MIHINLLPVRQIKKKIQAQNRVIGLGITLLGVLVVLGLISMVLAFKVGELRASINDLNIEKKKYQTTINQIEKLKKDQALLETKLNTISQLKKGSQLTVRVMDAIADVTPTSRLWLQSLSFSGNTLRVSGTALDNATIADYMEAIVASPFFGGAELSGTTSTSVAGRALKSFSLTIRVVNPDDVQEETDQGAGKAPQK